MAPFPRESWWMILNCLPECDLYISYVRITRTLHSPSSRSKKPVILGVSFGPGFLRQAKGINENVVAPVTMCSLEDNTWVPEINEFAKVFGRPSFEVKVQDDGTIESVRVIRGSPCGSTVAASAELHGTHWARNSSSTTACGSATSAGCPGSGRPATRKCPGSSNPGTREAVNEVSPAAGARVKQFTDEMRRSSTRK